MFSIVFSEFQCICELLPTAGLVATKFRSSVLCPLVVLDMRWPAVENLHQLSMTSNMHSRIRKEHLENRLLHPTSGHVCLWPLKFQCKWQLDEELPVDHSRMLAERVPTAEGCTAVGFFAGKHSAPRLNRLPWNAFALHPLWAFFVSVLGQSSDCGENSATAIAGEVGTSLLVQVKTLWGEKHSWAGWTLWVNCLGFLLGQKRLQIFNVFEFDFFPFGAILLLYNRTCKLEPWH